MSFGGSPKCRVCGKAVYHAERSEINEEFHKRCMVCQVDTCKKRLDSTTFAMHEDLPYCKSCHGKLFGIAGYGFGGGAAGPMGTTNARAPLQAKVGTSDFDGVPKECGPDGCPRCGKTVYAAEKVLAAGRVYHKGRCFRCFECNKGLDSSTVANHGAAIYCKGCHGAKYGPKGFGFGQGAGALTLTQ